MAGFLRKKTKDAPVKPVPSAPIPLVAAVSPPAAAPAAPLPLFARFSTSSSTTKSTNGMPASARTVSSPMVLSSNARRDSPQRAANRGHGQAPPAEAARKRSSKSTSGSLLFQNGLQDALAQNQGPNKTLPSVQSGHVHSESPLTPPAPIVDKPLPPPTPPTSSADPSGSIPTQSSIKQTRPPPSAFQKQQSQQSQPRIVDDAGDAEENRPSSFQPFYSAPSSTSLVSNPASRHSSTNNPLTSPTKRNPSLSNTNLAPQILPPIANRKMHQQNPPAPAFGRQNLPTTAAQTQTPHLSERSSVANQDLQPDNVNANMSMTGASSSRMGMQQSDNAARSSMSDRGLDIDLPPEFASLFHNFNQQFDLEDRKSVHSTRIPTAINSNEHVPASNVPPSSTDKSITPRPPISISSPSRESLLSSRPDQHPLPPLPPPPTVQSAESNMGAASSHAIGNGLLPSSMKDFYPPRTSSYSNNPAVNQPQMHNRRHSPPLPPVTASPILNQDVSPNFSPRSEVPSDKILKRPSMQDPDFQGSGSSPRKSIHSQASPTVPVTGKPRIFAAMTPQMDEIDRETASLSGAPPQHVQPSAKKQPSQSTMHVQQPQSQHQPSAKEWNASINGSDSFKPAFSSLQPPATPPKFSNRSIEQLPPTPASYTRSNSRLSRSVSKPDVRLQPQHVPPMPSMKDPKKLDERLQSQDIPQTSGKESKPDEQRPQSQHISQRPGKDSKSDERGPQPQQVPQTPRSRSRKVLRSDEQRPQSQQRSPSRSRKLSKPRPDASSQHSDIVLPSTPDSQHRTTSARSFTKSRPSTPAASPHKPLFGSPKPNGAPLDPAIQLHEDMTSKAEIPLDDDPIARVEGVTSMKPKEKETKKDEGSNGKKLRDRKTSRGSYQSSLGTRESLKVGSEKGSVSAVVEGVAPPTPISPEEHRKTKTKKKRRDSQIESILASVVDDSDSAVTAAEELDPESEPESEPEPILPSSTIVDIISDPQLLSSLLTFFSFYDWCVLSSLSKEIRILLIQTPVLREPILERFLKTVGYSRWGWDDADPLSLSLQDLHDYMRGVSTPTHEYARIAGMYAHSLTIHPNQRDPALIDIVRILTASTRAYTRVILRLRAQAEKEAVLAQQSRGLGITIKPPNFNSSSSVVRGHSRVSISSRAPSPTTSNYSYSHNGHVGAAGPTSVQEQSSFSHASLTFRSPLFRLRRAPLLRVFVPSPEGDWLSDKSVLACEEECKRAGVMHLMRLGDVVWDVAVGDEGNVGRLVWDGSYLIDLDYTYTSIGDLPKYMPALAFPPSYFHRVIRTGPVISNPIVHIDISPWGEEIAINLQLLQDRVRTETPQGAYHNVVRWVNRSSFVIRPGPAKYINQQGGRPQMIIPRIPIPDTDNLSIDSGWHGTVVVETEGTNEALADLQERCGPGAFPARSRNVSHHPKISQIQIENKKVFRILREKSRPGEIWIKTVGIKERIM